MGRWENPLSLEDLTEIIRHTGTLSAAELTRRLGKGYFTVAKAVQRIKRGLACPLTWVPCSECGGLIAGPRGRTAHPACERRRVVRWARERRRQRPGQSTPYVARYRREHPDAARELREREKAKLRERWPSLPLDVREAALAKVHAADARDYPLTLAQAEMSGAPWAGADDQIILKGMKRPAREVALELGRSLWAVRNRRVQLRRLGLLPDAKDRRRVDDVG